QHATDRLHKFQTCRDVCEEHLVLRLCKQIFEFSQKFGIERIPYIRDDKAVGFAPSVLQSRRDRIRNEVNLIKQFTNSFSRLLFDERRSIDHPRHGSTRYTRARSNIPHVHTGTIPSKSQFGHKLEEAAPVSRARSQSFTCI